MAQGVRGMEQAMSLPMPPDGGLPLSGIRTNPLPQTWEELGKQLKDGAVGAVEYVKESADRAKDMHGDGIGSIPRIPFFILRQPSLWPLLIKGDTKTENKETEE